MAVEKNQKSPSIFALLTVLVDDFHSMSKCWVFVPVGWLAYQFINNGKYSRSWGAGLSLRLGQRQEVGGWFMASFSSVGLVFLCNITIPSYACFSLQRSRFDEAFYEKSCGRTIGLDWACWIVVLPYCYFQATSTLLVFVQEAFCFQSRWEGW